MFIKKNLTLLITTFSVLTFSIVLFFIYQIPSVKETVALATTIKPETFTELYLENHQRLPKNANSQSAQSFSFTIHNLEYKTMTYPYEVYIQDEDGNKAMLVKDIVKLDQDQKKTIPVFYELLKPVTRAKVVVNLISKHQEVHFWISSESARLN